jgi:signal transduction histidine kinase
MRSPLRVLLVEDSPEDAALLARELKRGGFDPICHRVETQDAFRAALQAEAWDIIISDHTLPHYGGMRALADLQATRKDVPFILVSGTIGETLAIAAMKAGAQDYVLKDELARLPVAVAREVREAAIRAEQARTREQLLISERLASAGLLAAGVAHEINNPLAIAVGNVDVLAAALAHIAGDARVAAPPTPEEWDAWWTERVRELDEPLRDIRDALQRIRDIVRDVKLFSHGGNDGKGTLDLRRVVDSSCRMARNEIRRRARLVKDYGDVPPVEANESRLGQVILNLVINAAQAIPEGDEERNEIRFVTRTASDGRAVLEIADTGCGIPEQNLARVFDPFFTTKPVGVGTGLGLAICRRIVTELGGEIGVESQVGKGSLFRIVLPPASTDDVPAPPRAPSLSPSHSRILLIDDEAAVGRALARSLASHHDVIVTSSGAEALARIVGGERFDVILSDLLMPQVSGMDLHEQLCSVAPDQAARLIFLTVGALSPTARAFLDRVPNPRVEKPVELPNLLAIIAGYGRREAPRPERRSGTP